MKRVLIGVMLLAGLAASQESKACNLIKGAAAIKWDETCTVGTLSCRGEGDCAKLSCDGSSITIYMPDRSVIHGKVRNAVQATDNGDGTSTLNAPLMITVEEMATSQQQ